MSRGIIQAPPLGSLKNPSGQTSKVYVFSGEKGKRDSIVAIAQLSRGGKPST